MYIYIATETKAQRCWIDFVSHMVWNVPRNGFQDDEKWQQLYHKNRNVGSKVSTRSRNRKQTTRKWLILKKYNPNCNPLQWNWSYRIYGQVLYYKKKTRIRRRSRVVEKLRQTNQERKWKKMEHISFISVRAVSS